MTDALPDATLAVSQGLGPALEIHWVLTPSVLYVIDTGPNNK